MIVKGKEYNLDDLVKGLDLESLKFKNVSSNLMLTNLEISILEKNYIDYKTANSLKDLMIKIERVLDEDDIDPDTEDELEYVLKSIGERDYYENKHR